jgi:hypothetical protein
MIIDERCTLLRHRAGMLLLRLHGPLLRWSWVRCCASPIATVLQHTTCVLEIGKQPYALICRLGYARNLMPVQTASKLLLVRKEGAGNSNEWTLGKQPGMKLGFKSHLIPKSVWLFLEVEVALALADAVVLMPEQSTSAAGYCGC